MLHALGLRLRQRVVALLQQRGPGGLGVGQPCFCVPNVALGRLELLLERRYAGGGRSELLVARGDRGLPFPDDGLGLLRRASLLGLDRFPELVEARLRVARRRFPIRQLALGGLARSLSRRPQTSDAAHAARAR